MKYSLRISWGPQNKDIIVAQVADFFSGQWSSVTWAQDTGWRQFYFHNGWADSGQVLLLPTHLPLKGHKWHPQDFCCCCWAHPNSYICWVCKVLLTSSAMWITKDLLRNYDMLKSIFNLNCESFLILAIVRRPVSCFLQSLQHCFLNNGCIFHLLFIFSLSFITQTTLEAAWGTQ